MLYNMFLFSVRLHIYKILFQLLIVLNCAMF